MTKNKTMARPIRMDDPTWKMADTLANSRMPKESRPSLINRLIWEEAERQGRIGFKEVQLAPPKMAKKEPDQSADVQSADVQSADVQSADVQSADVQSAPDLPSTGEGNQSTMLADVDLEWED